jgi:hypothetical protein
MFGSPPAGGPALVSSFINLLSSKFERSMAHYIERFPGSIVYKSTIKIFVGLIRTKTDHDGIKLAPTIP